MVTLIAVTCGMACAATAKPAPVKKPAGPSILSKCRADLAKRLKLQEKDISLADAQPVTWSDTALGMPEIGKMYAQMLTPGHRFVLKARNVLYLYTTSAKACRYGGPVGIWAYSMLYTQPISNEANLNSDLYQCSLLGTNSIRLLSGIADYYPQADGIVVATRRMSRSSFDLLYVQANKPGKEKMLYHAFAFGAAAFDGSHDRWAAFVRPGVGGGWTVVVGSVSQKESKPRVLRMPEGVQPGEIAWSLDTLMILAKKGIGSIAYETNPADESPTWKQTTEHNFPGYYDFILNKSETLVIDEIRENGKPGFEVVREWFTGDRNVVARISDFTMRGYDLIGPYAFVWGERGSRQAAYSVSISSGDTVMGFVGSGRDIKPFAYRPHNSPMPKQSKIE